ncbi:MAG: polyphosphate polymerase domain-containing protein [Chitinophagales bacterium]|nr:polyphosphate polymerase domain-containing protein [Chitinophagales bacterium]
MSPVTNMLDGLDPISLEEMDNVKLLNRVDTKYIIPVRSLHRLFDLLKNNYYILEIEGRRSFSYETTYFDTPDFRFYKDHHNNVSCRIKVRNRSYIESNLHFFEIKMKENFRTNKYREKLNSKNFELSEKYLEKIRSFYARDPLKSLTSTLMNTYTRITLVNKMKTERCTIDINLVFQDPENPVNTVPVSNIAIIELKQSDFTASDGIASSLRDRHVYPSSISKYALGLIRIHPELKHNFFKPLLLKLDKIQQQ